MVRIENRFNIQGCQDVAARLCSPTFACDLRYDLHVTFSDKYQYLNVYAV